MKEKKQSALSELLEYAGSFKTLTYLSLILSALSRVLSLMPFVFLWRIIRIFSKAKYGDIDVFVRKLKDMGYEKVELIDTTDGSFIQKQEAGWMGLSGSALLIGRK